MNIPQSVIRPFEPHGIPTFLMVDCLRRLLIKALTSNIIATRLYGLYPGEVTEDMLIELEDIIINELIDASLTGVGCGIKLNHNRSAVICHVIYFEGDNDRMHSLKFTLDFNL